jgi:hypothetical protein
MIAIDAPLQDASVNGRANRVLRVMAGLDPAIQDESLRSWPTLARIAEGREVCQQE